LPSHSLAIRPTPPEEENSGFIYTTRGNISMYPGSGWWWQCRRWRRKRRKKRRCSQKEKEKEKKAEEEGAEKEGMEDGGDEGPSLRSLADTHSPHSDTGSATSNSRRYSSSYHAPKLINRVEDAPHTHGGAQSRSHRCISSYHGRRYRAARAPDVASAQGEWEEKPGEEGGATDKREAMLHLPTGF
jgi:hypothetical protein